MATPKEAKGRVPKFRSEQEEAGFRITNKAIALATIPPQT